jgi:midasin
VCITQKGIDRRLAAVHGAAVTLIDGLGALGNRSAINVDAVRRDCYTTLGKMVQIDLATFIDQSIDNQSAHLFESDTQFGILPFIIEKGTTDQRKHINNDYSLSAPTCARNMYRLLRSMCTTKPILLEGAPGAGKSSLVMALAAYTRHSLIRLNLSEQTVRFYLMYFAKLFIGSWRFVRM